MKDDFKNIFQDKIILWSFLISVLLLIAIGIYIVTMYSQIPPVLPLYNHMAWGYSRLGRKVELFIPIGMSLLFFICNTITSALLYKKNVLISRMISTISFIIILFTNVYILKIMQLML